MAGKRAAAAPAAADGTGPVAGAGQHSLEGYEHQEAAANSLIALHRSRCWDWHPAAVVAIAACPDAALAVVGLETGDLELWDLTFMVCLQRIVAFNTEVTALAWARDSLDKSWRTFAAALDGSLAEVDWKQSQLIASTDSGAGTVWSLAAQPVQTVRAGFSHQLAAACDDGSVRIFSVEAGEPGLVYERSLGGTQQGRVLAVAWHPSGTSIVAGGADGCIHALDVITGHESLRITVSASTTQPVCVWRLLVLPDGTIVSGDSGGAVQFWDGRFGSLLQRFTIHVADVLALAASPDASRVWASGVDSQVAMFERCANASGLIGSSVASSSNSGAQWVYTHYKRPHTHDVRALEVVQLGGGQGAVLLSGAADAQLMLYPVNSFLQVHPARLTKCPQAPVCQLAPPSASDMQQGQGRRGRGSRSATQPPLTPTAAQPASSHLLCAQQDTLDVWQLGATTVSAGWQATQEGLQHHENGSSRVEGEAVDLVSAPRHLARIKCKTGRVRASALSPNCAFVACSAGSRGLLRVYNLQGVDLQAELAMQHQPVSVVRAATDREVEGVTAVAVTQNHLFVGLHDGKVQMLQLPALGATHGASDTATGLQPQLVTICTVSTWGEPATAAVRQASKVADNSKRAAGAAWHQFMPAITCLHASADGGLLAASGPHGISLMRVMQQAPSTAGSLQRVGKPIKPHRDAPILSMSFNQDASQLAVIFADGHLTIIDVATGRPTPWSLEHDAAVAGCLNQLPGTVQAVSFAPANTASTGSCLLVHSAGGFCILDTSLPVANPSQGQKRRRGAQKPVSWGSQSVAGAGPVTDMGHKGSRAHEAVKGNGRAVLLPDPVAFVGYISASELLLLERPWEDVLSSMTPPLYRPRYGA